MIEFFTGIRDSVTLWKTAQSSRTLRHVAIRLLPLYLVTCVLGVWFYIIDHLLLDTTLHRLVIWSIWNVFCMVPLYLVGALVQTRYSSKITSVANNNNTWSRIISESLYGIVLNLTYIIQTSIFNFVVWLCLPAIVSRPINQCVSIVSVAWASSFSAYEMVLITKGKGLLERIYYLETQWSYALGFGLWLSLLYHYCPQAIALSIWQYFLLLMMLHTMRINLPVNSSKRLKIFYFAQWFAILLIKLCLSTIDWLTSLRNPAVDRVINTENLTNERIAKDYVPPQLERVHSASGRIERSNTK